MQWARWSLDYLLKLLNTVVQTRYSKYHRADRSLVFDQKDFVSSNRVIIRRRIMLRKSQPRCRVGLVRQRVLLSGMQTK